VIATQEENGGLRVTVSATGQGNALRQVQFRRPINGTIQIAGTQVDASVGYLQTLPGGTVQFTFLLRPITVGQVFHVPFVVTDACGDWPTFAGRGGGIAASEQPKQPCRPDDLPPAVRDRCTDEAINVMLANSEGCRSACIDKNSPACQSCLEAVGQRAHDAFEKCKDSLCVQTILPPSPTQATTRNATTGTRGAPTSARSTAAIQQRPSASIRSVEKPASCKSQELWNCRQGAALDGTGQLAVCAGLALFTITAPGAPICVAAALIAYTAQLTHCIENYGCGGLDFCTPSNICCSFRQTACGHACCEDRCERCDPDLQVCLVTSTSLTGTYTCSYVMNTPNLSASLKLRMDGEPREGNFYPAVVTAARFEVSGESTNGCGHDTTQGSGSLPGGSTEVLLNPVEGSGMAQLAHDSLFIPGTIRTVIHYINPANPRNPCVTEEHDQGGINLRCPDIEIPYSLHPNAMKGTKTVGDGSGGTYTITWDLDLKTACDE